MQLNLKDDVDVSSV